MDFVTLAQAAKMLACSRSVLQKLCFRGLEGPRKIGKYWVMPRALVETMTIGPTGRPPKKKGK